MARELVAPQLEVVVLARDLQRRDPRGPCLVLECIIAVRKPDVLPVVTGPSRRQSRAEVVRALRPDEAHAIDVELVSLGFASHHRVVIENEHLAALELLEERGGAKPGNPATRHDEVVALTGVGRSLAGRLTPDLAVAEVVRGGDRRPHVAVRARVIADAARSFPREAGRPLRLLKQWRLRVQQQRAAREQRRVEEIAPRDRHVETEVTVLVVEGLERVVVRDTAHGFASGERSGLRARTKLHVLAESATRQGHWRPINLYLY